MSMFNRSVLSEGGLKQLGAHVYKSGTYSPLDNLLNTHWWNPVVEYMPMSIAPNMITLIGTLLVAATLGLSTVTLYQEQSHGISAEIVPSWVHITIAIILFVYQTLDAIDGKQARRTSNSSPLGQLFDHGCDALITTIALYHIILALGLDHSWQAVMLYTATLTTFFMAQWEESATRVLRTNVNGLGVSEAQCLMMAIHVIAAIVDWRHFRHELTVSFSLKDVFTWHITHPMNHYIAVVGTIGLAFVASGFLYTMVFQVVGLRSMKSFAGTLLLAVAMIVSFAPSSSDVLTLHRQHPRLLFALYAISQTYLTTKMIVHSMAHEPYLTMHKTALLLPITVIVDVMLPTWAAGFLKFSVVFALLSYLSYVQSTIVEIASSLKISAFSINPPRTAAPPMSEQNIESTVGGGATNAVDLPKRAYSTASIDGQPKRSRSKSSTRKRAI